MRKITALTALLALSLSFSTTHAGDRSSLEPQSRSGPSFIPAITPPLSGSPGNDKYLQSNVSGVVSWATKPGKCDTGGIWFRRNESSQSRHGINSCPSGTHRWGIPQDWPGVSGFRCGYVARVWSRLVAPRILPCAS